MNKEQHNCKLVSKSPVKSVSEYLEAVEYGHEYFGNPFLWYRGVSSKAYKLVPSLCRSSGWEYDPVSENSSMSEFIHKAKGIYKPTQNIMNKWDWMQVCQHYGMKTRLLDWSEGSLLALYFAVENYRQDKYPRVWLLEPRKLNKESTGKELIYFTDSTTSNNEDYEAVSRFEFGSTTLPEHTVALNPPHSNDRLKIQKGVFTVHGRCVDYLSKQNSKAKNKFLCAIDIHPEYVESIKKGLISAGIDTSDIYPDLGGLATELIRKWQL